MSRNAVACVLRSGGIYTPEWVYRLRKMVTPFMPPKTEFICLSDQHIPEVTTIRLMHNWPGYWSKMELFRNGVFTGFDQVLYLDLDVLILDDLKPLFLYNPPSIFQGDTAAFCIAPVTPYNEKNPKRSIGYQSSVMCWDPTCRTFFYREFEENPQAHMQRWYGDQDFLHHISPHESTFPEGWVLKSDKIQDWNETTPPQNVKIALSIRPKNNELAKTHKWVREIWGDPIEN